MVIGHSMGANAAIGYAASHGPLAAVVAIAPGHLPEVARNPKSRYVMVFAGHLGVPGMARNAIINWLKSL